MWKYISIIIESSIEQCWTEDGSVSKQKLKEYKFYSTLKQIKK